MPRVVVFDELGGPEVLRLEEIDEAAPGPNEVRMRVEAIGVNRADQMIRTGVFAYQARLPGARIGTEASGTIDAVGSNVQHLAVGDLVLVTAVEEMDRDGTYAEQLVVPGSKVIIRPGGLDAIRAAALWNVYAAAYGALVQAAAMRPADTIVITAASSSVGLAAIQIASSLGATIIAGTRSAAKKAALLDAGADHVIATDEEDLPGAVSELTDGRGADIILDAVAGPGLKELAKAAKYSGTIVITGWLDTRPALLPMNWPLTMIGYANLEHTLDSTTVDRIAAFLDAGLRSGSLSPIVSKVFSLDEIVSAHRYLESNAQFGKIVAAVEP